MTKKPTVYLAATGDLREIANRKCDGIQQAMAELGVEATICGGVE